MPCFFFTRMNQEIECHPLIISFFLQKSWKICRPHYRFLLFNNRTIHQKSRKVINGRYSVPSSPPLLFSFECKQVQRSKRREVIKKNQAIDPNDFIAKSNKIKVREMERWTWNAFFFLLFNKQPQKITPIDTWGRCRTACRSGRQCLLIGSLRRRQEEETGRCDTQQKIELRIVFTRICWTDRATSGEADTKNQEMFGDGLKDGTQQRMAGRARLHGNQWVAHPRPNEAIHHVHGHRFAASFPTGKRKRHAFIPRRWPTQNKRKRTRTVKRIEFRFSEQCPSSFHVSTGGVFFPIFFLP